MEEPKFQVVVPDLSSSVDDWRRALRAPGSALPALSSEQKEMARRFQVSEEDYARGFLAGLYGRERNRNRGIALGKLVEEILAGLGPEYRLLAVKKDMDTMQWVFRIQKAQERIFHVPIPYELADDLLDSGLAEYKNQLKDVVLRSIERDELAGRN